MTYSTIEGFEDLTPQQVFDISAKHLLTQSEKSMDFAGACLYDNGMGEKCAAGVFLTGDVSDYEGMGWYDLVNSGVAPPNNIDIISSLQEVHDTVDVPDWPQFLMAVADKYELSKEVLIA